MPPNDHATTVLVVEDEALLLFSISDELTAQGFVVFEASNAHDAVTLLTAHPEIEIVFTDIDMPGSMDGLKLLALVRERWPPVRVLVTSGKKRPTREMLMDENWFLPKPYTTAGVVAAIQAAAQ
jgi:CheY-like chemotaxis protein